MSETMLQTAMPELLATPAAAVRAPDLPVAVTLQEGHDLLTLAERESVWQSLVAVGVELGRREQLRLMLGALRAAESNWVVMRDRRKSETQTQLETAADTLRGAILVAARWSLRGDDKALATLAAISEGEGVADLAQDLSDLAELCERNLTAFERDQSFDAPARIAEARTLYAQLAASTSKERLDTEQTRAIDLRNRAFTELDGIMDELREAGRYAFRDQDDLRSRFASAYERRKRKARARRKANGAAEATQPST